MSQCSSRTERENFALIKDTAELHVACIRAITTQRHSPLSIRADTNLMNQSVSVLESFASGDQALLDQRHYIYFCKHRCFMAKLISMNVT